MELEAAFEWPLAGAEQIRAQQQRQCGWKLCSFHAPEAECIGKGKASAPHEFPCQSLDLHHQCPRPGAASSLLHANALPGNPYVTRSLSSSMPPRSSTAARSSAPVSTKGYRGHDAATRTSPSAPTSANCVDARPSKPSLAT